jgi:hypothetical protein
VSTAWLALSWARDEGLLSWDDGKQGTLHPLVRVVRI